jgi:hypothetical protein
MLAAIHLNDQLRVRAKKIDDVWADGLLTTEAKAIKLLPSQVRPKADFRVGRIRA